jgi:Lon protease-like protein
MMELPLFPLKNVVLFPGMPLPLHIFEPRYREMINRCLDEQLPFGVLLIKEGQEVGPTATPYEIGTAARILQVKRLEEGRMNIVTVGTQRFRVREFHYNRSYLTGTVEQLPFVNGSTKLANDLMHKIRPRLLEYVELIAKANKTQLGLDRLPEEPTSLAFLVAMSLQISHEHKQAMLTLPSIPELLAREIYHLSCEGLLLQHMIDTQGEVADMNLGPTGALFPN